MRNFLAVAVHIWCELLLRLIWGKNHAPVPYWHAYCAALARSQGMTRESFASQSKGCFDVATERLREEGMI